MCQFEGLMHNVPKATNYYKGLLLPHSSSHGTRIPNTVPHIFLNYVYVTQSHLQLYLSRKLEWSSEAAVEAQNVEKCWFDNMHVQQLSTFVFVIIILDHPWFWADSSSHRHLTQRCMISVSGLRVLILFLPGTISLIFKQIPETPHAASAQKGKSCECWHHSMHLCGEISNSGKLQSLTVSTVG